MTAFSIVCLPPNCCQVRRATRGKLHVACLAGRVKSRKGVNTHCVVCNLSVLRALIVRVRVLLDDLENSRIELPASLNSMRVESCARAMFVRPASHHALDVVACAARKFDMALRM